MEARNGSRSAAPGSHKMPNSEQRSASPLHSATLRFENAPPSSLSSAAQPSRSRARGHASTPHAISMAAGLDAPSPAAAGAPSGTSTVMARYTSRYAMCQSPPPHSPITSSSVRICAQHGQHSTPRSARTGHPAAAQHASHAQEQCAVPASHTKLASWRDSSPEPARTNTVFTSTRGGLAHRELVVVEAHPGRGGRRCGRRGRPRAARGGRQRRLLDPGHVVP
jgi:hypothetical protein